MFDGSLSRCFRVIIATMIRFLLFAALFASLSTAGCPELKALIARTYTFSPSRLRDDAQYEQKAKEMDLVWDMVEKDKANLAPCLRTELENAPPSSWFAFEGSALLLRVQDDDPARRLRLRALENVAMDDVALRSWTEDVARFGALGLDTSKAAELGSTSQMRPIASRSTPLP